jgi:ABC-type transporter MlaC component
MAKPAPAASAETVALYEKLVATNPKVERKGAMLPYTSVNGNMFSLLTKSGTLVLRLPEAEREAFLKKYKTKVTEQYGAVMREYVDVPNSLLKKTQELRKYFDVSYAYVSALRPKPTTRKKAATKARR